VPRVSCIIPTYNYGKYLSAAIESVLAQEYPEQLEIIVVDDGSTDDTPAVLAAYEDRVHAIRQENGGVTAATSAGLQVATGRLLTFLGADDLWPANRTQLLVDALRAAPQAGIAYGDMEMIDAAGSTTAPSFREAMGIASPSGRVFDRLFVHNFISGGAMMVRAELASHFSPIPPYAANEDWWIATQVARIAEVTAIPQPTNRYRYHGANMNLGADGERLTRLYESEIPFRLWMLQTAEPGLVGPGQMTAAVGAVDQMIDHVVGANRDAAAVLGLGTDARERSVAAMHEASAALDEGDLDGALVRLVAAIGYDPLWDQPRDLVRALAPLVEAQAAETAVGPVSQIEPEPAPLPVSRP
jgi:hypothetical protein